MTSTSQGPILLKLLSTSMLLRILQCWVLNTAQALHLQKVSLFQSTWTISTIIGRMLCRKMNKGICRKNQLHFQPVLKNHLFRYRCRYNQYAWNLCMIMPMAAGHTVFHFSGLVFVPIHTWFCCRLSALNKFFTRSWECSLNYSPERNSGCEIYCTVSGRTRSSSQ